MAGGAPIREAPIAKFSSTVLRSRRVCGIAGVVGRFDPEVLARMTATLAHRGPDAGAVHLGDGWGLGHRRLSIIDLEGGAQPMSTPDEATWVTYNGEIYDFAARRDELARLGHRFTTSCDTEVLLWGYREWGDAVVEHLNGMFAFAIWDARARRLLLARDRVGIKPLYYAEIGGVGGPTIAFASEPKALLQIPAVSRELDPTALDAYLELHYVPPPLSMFRGIRQLPPGHTLVWHEGRARIERFWDAPPRIDRRRSDEEWAEVIAPVLEEAITMQTVADVPVGAFLSGGLDSSTIVAVLSERGGGPVETFCVGYGADARQWDERAEARLVARHFGTRHHELELSVDVLAGLESSVRGFDEPYGNPTALLTSALSAFTRRHVTVALAGDGGDELFGGYPRYRGMMLSQVIDRLPRAAIRGLGDVLARVSEGNRARAYRRWARQFMAGAALDPAERYATWVAYGRAHDRDRLLSPGMRDRVRAAGRVDPVRRAFESPAEGDLAERAAYADLHGFLPENVLRGSDRMSMAHGLELRVPLCDHRLVELCMKVPSRRRIGPLVTKRILRKIMRGRLPTRVLRRPKLGFTAPLGVWLRRDLEGLLGDWLGPEVVRERGVLDPQEVARLVAEHQSGRRDHGQLLWSLVVLEQWWRMHHGDGPA
jgi:asparagine synthase (glutamine-hydrolysing)